VTDLDWSRFWLVLKDEAGRMWWVFALGVLVAAFIKTFKWDKKIRKRLKGSTHGAIALATGVGLVSPLCSCGIVPLVISLIYGGVPLAPVFALLITSPLMSPDAFLITYGGLGPALAWGKLASALFAGLAGGYAVVGMQRLGWIAGEGLLGRERPDIREKCLDDASPDDPRRGLEVPERRFWYFGLMVKDMTWIVGRFLVPAIVLEAALVAFVPLGWVRDWVGGPGAMPVFWGALAGVPLPLPQVAAVPLIRGLMEHGMQPAAAMAFLVAGPVTSIPAVTLLATVFQRSVIVVYLAVGLATALLAGFALLALG
jgi:uncharacterized membrane protein YraQ (UPF0718 family)